MKKAESSEEVRVRLLGPPAIERNGEREKVETRKALALLAFLAVERRSHARPSLIVLLWPEADERSGRAVLRRTLHALARMLPPGVLLIEQDQVALGEDPRLWIDVDELRRIHLRCVESNERCPECPRPLRAAVDLYHDGFLAGFTLKDSVAFDDWQFFQTEGFERVYASALDRLVSCLSSAENYDAAIEYASRWLALDELDEAPHLALMRLHALAGGRAAALRQYESCRAVIRKEIGEDPSAQLRHLAQDIQSGRFPEPEAEPWDDRTPAGMRPISAALDRHPATLLALRFTGAAAEEDAGTRFLSSLYGLTLRYGGRIERHIGQTVLIVFGHGPTRESAPELAVRAAIECRAAARRDGVILAAGISSGMISIPSDSTANIGAESLSGPAMGEAKRLAASARGSEILVSESTFRSTRSVAHYTRVREPGEGAGRYRLGALLDEPHKTRGIEGLRGRLVGRDEELAKLRKALEDVLRGERRLVTVTGEAGVGKSRLVAEGRSAVRRPGSGELLWLEGRCLDIGAGAAYWPFIDVLRHYFAWRPEDTDRRHIERIEQTVNDLEARSLLAPGCAPSTIRHLFLLLSATDPDGGTRDRGTDDPEARRIGIFEAVRDFVEALARGRPLVLVLEDLHWADAISLDLIGFLMDSINSSSSGVMPALGLLCVYRSQQDHRCRHLSTLAFEKCPGRYTEIVLRGLTPEESTELVEALLETRGLPEPLTRAILDRAQGNPFFLEEIVRSLIDAGVLYRAQGSWRTRAACVAGGVPESVESVIRATTDRLPGPARRVLRAASVLGRVFDAEVLRGMTREGEMARNLRLLEDHGLVYEDRTVPRREFSFRHVLTRDAVYAGIPEPDRRELHALAARIILEHFGERPEPYLEGLAYHFERAGLEEQAVRYLHLAGRKAIRAGDNQAAIGLLERALALVRAWPPGPQRSATELEIQVALGVPVTAITGYGSPETRKVYQRALDLCKADDRSATAFAATYGLWRYHTVRGQLAPSAELAERLMDLSRDLNDDVMQLEAQRALACVLTHSGRVKEADRVLEAGMAAYDPARHRGNAYIYGHDPATTFYCYRALGLWLLGFPDSAAATIDRLWELLRDSTHRLSLTYACSIGAQVFQLRGDVERVLSMSSRGVALAAEGHLPMFGSLAEVMQGWAVMMGGDVARGVKSIREGVERWDAVSGGSFRLYLRTILAEAVRRSGDVAGAADILQETSVELESSGCDRVCEPELYRLQGELHLDSGDPAAAEPLLQKAADTAEASGACSLGLRAAMSLARLHALRGDVVSGRRLLQDALSMIHEGYETADLREASRLLKELR